MARQVPFLFCRYAIFGEDEQALSAIEEFALLKAVRGQRIAYRVREPSADDHDTYLMKPREKKLINYRIHTWEIAQDIKFRERTRYDHNVDETADDMVETDEIRHTKFIAVPALGALAVSDQISERSLGARSAVGRFTSIIETLTNNEVAVTFAGTPQDVQRALDTWTLDRFTFTVRPFNPTPTKLGEKVHELLVADSVGTFQAVALPDESHDMRDSHEGIIAEAKGLSDAGYGQIGASGRTPSGVRATISKPKFDRDKEKNKQRQAENRTLKVYVDTAPQAEEQERLVVRAILDMYAERE